MALSSFRRRSFLGHLGRDVNSPTGAFACSVGNVTGVAYYSFALPRSGGVNTNRIWEVSWRDDRDVAHRVNGALPSHPDELPIDFAWR